MKSLTSYIKLFVLLFLCFVTCERSNITTTLPEFGNRILNGKPADNNQFPYQVSLQKHLKHNCGGSIISEVKVLTAGHCVTSRYGRPLPNEIFRILAGTNYLSNTDPLNYYSVKKISIHPKYDAQTIQYDYAIVFIDGHFDFKLINIQKIDLAIQNPRPGAVCYLSGWGDVSSGRDIVTPNELQFATITIDPPNVCEKAFGNYFKYSQMVCAGQINKENAGCGDSGGPLNCNNYLTGVVSFGHEYYDSKSPDVYSSVFYASDWINASDLSGSKINEVRGLTLIMMCSVPITLNVIL